DPSTWPLIRLLRVGSPFPVHPQLEGAIVGWAGDSAPERDGDSAPPAIVERQRKPAGPDVRIVRCRIEDHASADDRWRTRDERPPFQGLGRDGHRDGGGLGLRIVLWTGHDVERVSAGRQRLHGETAVLLYRAA